MNDRVKKYLEELEKQTDSYQEFLINESENIKTTDLNTIDATTPTYFDALIKHPNFYDLVLALIEDYNPHFWEKGFNVADNINIDGVERLTHEKLGNILKISLSFDKISNNSQNNKKTYIGKGQKDLYLKEGYFLDARHHYGDNNTVYLHNCYHPLGAPYDYNTKLFGILLKLNGKKKINGMTFKEYYTEHCQMRTALDYCSQLALMKKQMANMKFDYESDMKRMPKKVEKEAKEFKEYDDIIKLIDDKPTM